MNTDPGSSSVILFLTDLHFEKSNVVGETQNRERVLNSLVNTILDLESDWRPTIICISGDITNKGLESGYEAAAAWLRDVMEMLSISPERLVICPGNHDMELHHVKGLERPTDYRSVKTDFAHGPPEKRLAAFNNYVRFCENMKVPKSGPNSSIAHLTGVRNIDSLRFVILNSAWYCTGKQAEDQAKLWIVKPLVEELGLPLVHKDENDVITVGLCHHPPIMLHREEQDVHNSESRTPTLKFLYQRCHILLSGDTHSAPTSSFEQCGCFHYVSGPTYESSEARNHCRLIRIQKEGCFEKIFEFQPTSGRDEWKCTYTSTMKPFQWRVAQWVSDDLKRTDAYLVDYSSKTLSAGFNYSTNVPQHSRQTHPISNVVAFTPLKAPIATWGKRIWDAITFMRSRNASDDAKTVLELTVESESSSKNEQSHKFEALAEEIILLIEVLDRNAAFNRAIDAGTLLDLVPRPSCDDSSWIKLNRTVIDALLESVPVLNPADRAICIEALKRAKKRGV